MRKSLVSELFGISYHLHPITRSGVTRKSDLSYMAGLDDATVDFAGSAPRRLV
jgi:hypothetical protein